MSDLVVKTEDAAQGVSIFNNGAVFEHAQRIAKMLSSSDIVPEKYRGNISNTLVALEMANRMGESPLMVMQNLDIIHGKPSFNSKFTISRLNTCGQFSPIRFKYSGDGDSRTCIAYAKDLATGQILEGPPVSIAMAKKEGWYNKAGSKWPSMPELMLSYRAGAFFGRLFAPQLTMGMQTSEEVQDISHEEVKLVSSPATAGTIEELNDKAKTRKPRNSRVEQPVVTQGNPDSKNQDNPEALNSTADEELM